MKPDFSKYIDGLMPAIIQDANSDKVLMLGFINDDSYEKTIAEKRVVFYSRSKKRIWIKGETSGNYLDVKEILLDCDRDTMLIKVIPQGPVCHQGTDTCFNEENVSNGFLEYLENIITARKNNPADSSYTSSLFSSGINRIAQKVGEEAVELVIESKDNNDEMFLNEAADLLFHYLVLLQSKGKRMKDVIEILRKRDKTS